MNSHASVWPSQVGVMDSHTSGLLLEFRSPTPKLRCDPSSWGGELPYLGAAPPVGVLDSHASVWPHKLV